MKNCSILHRHVIVMLIRFQKVEKEDKTVEKTSSTGGWCIHDTKELGEGGFHKTDLKLAQALALFFKGMECFQRTERLFRQYEAKELTN